MTADATLPASDDLTPEMLGWWEELAANATEGPWRNVFLMVGPDGGPMVCDVVTEDESANRISDADFLAAARTAVPALLSGVRSRDARIAELEVEADDWRRQAREWAESYQAVLDRKEELKAELDARDAVVQEAQHAYQCHSTYAVGYPSREYHPCDCWKSRYKAGATNG